jgi:hypothetical protein
MKRIHLKKESVQLESLDQVVSWILAKGEPTIGLYCTQHLALILNVSPKTVNSWKSRGLIAALKVGNRNFFWEDNVREFLETHLIKRTKFQQLQNSINYN